MKLILQQYAFNDSNNEKKCVEMPLSLDRINWYLKKLYEAVYPSRLLHTAGNLLKDGDSHVASVQGKVCLGIYCSLFALSKRVITSSFLLACGVLYYYLAV